MDPLRTFTGGLLTTCGLDHAMGPHVEPAGYFAHPGIGLVRHPLHGRVSHSAARLRGHGVDWTAPVPVVFVEGEVVQAMPFGERLVLHRRIEAEVGSTRLRIRDTVTNQGYAPTACLVL